MQTKLGIHAMVVCMTWDAVCSHMQTYTDRSTLNSQGKNPGGTRFPSSDVEMSKQKTGMASNPSGYI